MFTSHFVFVNNLNMPIHKIKCTERHYETIALGSHILRAIYTQKLNLKPGNDMYTSIF